MWNVEKVRDAWILASHYHNGQKYGGQKEGEQIEYLEHIGAVMIEVQNAIQQDPSVPDQELAVLCAIMHDILEDSDCSPERIRLRFGTDVLAGVQALTKNDDIASKDERMLDSLQRIRAHASPAVGIVKMADRICNLAAPPFYWTKEKMIAYVKEAQLIHDQLKHCSSYLANRLAAKMEQYQIDYIELHQQEYQQWALCSSSEFQTDKLEELVHHLQQMLGAEHVSMRVRVIGFDLTVQGEGIQLLVNPAEAEGNNRYLVSVLEKGANQAFIAFLQRFSQYLEGFVDKKHICYWFEHETLGVGKDFVLE